MTRTVNIPSVWRSLHRDTLADVWESVPFDARRDLLAGTSCPIRYQAACARARWCDLDAILRNEIEPKFDPKIVSMASQSLRAREEA
jgi:hypothetical protein